MWFIESTFGKQERQKGSGRKRCTTGEDNGSILNYSIEYCEASPIQVANVAVPGVSTVTDETIEGAKIDMQVSSQKAASQRRPYS